jgi:hypothetical protein
VNLFVEQCRRQMKSIRGERMNKAYLKDEYNYRLRHGLKPEKLESESKRSLKVSGTWDGRFCSGLARRTRRTTF